MKKVTPIRGANVIEGLRKILDRAEKGEITAFAMAYMTDVEGDTGCTAAWSPGSNLVLLLGSIALINHQIIAEQEAYNEDPE